MTMLTRLPAAVMFTTGVSMDSAEAAVPRLPPAENEILSVAKIACCFEAYTILPGVPEALKLIEPVEINGAPMTMLPPLPVTKERLLDPDNALIF